MSNPILALIPSGTKAQKVYSVLPSDGSGDFDFDRANGLATRINKEGLIEEVANDTPRLDYKNSTCPSLLLESESTNLQAYSQDFNNAVWFKLRTTVTSNNTTSPSGELNADKIQRTSTIASYIQDGFSKNASQIQYTTSVFVKQGEGDYLALRVQGNFFQRIDLRFQFSTKSFIYTNEAGIAVLNSTSVTEYSNGWLKLSYSFLSDTQSSLNNYFSARATSGNVDSNDTSSTAFVYLWGCQVEQSTFGSSYIPTTTIQTRFADVCGNAGNADLFDSNEGAMFVDIQKSFKDSSFGRISISDESSANRVVIGKENSNTQFRMFVAHTNGTIDAQKYTDVNFDVRNKFIITWKLNDFKFYQNGSLIHSDTSGSIPIGLSKFAFNENNLGSQDFLGKINGVRYYNKVLTQAEAIKLTT